MTSIVPIASIPAAEIDRLLDQAFGADRRGRTAYKLREGAEAIPELSFAAVEDGAPVGSIQCWPVELTGSDGGTTPLILVGPVAVDPERQQQGIGRAMMEHARDECRRAGCYKLALSSNAKRRDAHRFYESLGFVQVSESYLEDNIPHIEMQFTA